MEKRETVVSAYHGDAEAPYVRLDAVAFLVQVRVDPLGLKLDMIKKIKNPKKKKNFQNGLFYRVF